MVSPSEFGDARLRVEVVDDGSAERVVIRGEADVADVEHLAATLTDIQLDGAKSVLLDVSDLAFADVATLRRLTAFAHHVKQTGRTVMTCGAGPTLHRMAFELDVHDELGLHGPGSSLP